MVATNIVVGSIETANRNGLRFPMLKIKNPLMVIMTKQAMIIDLLSNRFDNYM